MSRDDHAPRELRQLIRAVTPLTTRDTIASAAERISRSGAGGLPVVDDDGRLAGYLGERDLLGAICPGYLPQLGDTDFFTRDLTMLGRWVRRAADLPVADHMRSEPATLHEDDTETHAADLFLRTGSRALPVVAGDGTLVGVVRVGDLIAELMRRLGDGA
ncbi:MAG: CBS domain-containing protein [Actinomycetota bacterium]